MKTDKYTSITADSRQVQSGTLFVALRGFSVDGHKFIGSALSKGAAAIVYDNEEAASEWKNTPEGEKAEWFRVEDSRKA